jgi:hypothetical protein
MLPGHLVDDFWSEVAREISPRNPEKAAGEIDRFRRSLEEKGAEEAIYHWGVAEVAESIKRGGFKAS